MGTLAIFTLSYGFAMIECLHPVIRISFSKHELGMRAFPWAFVMVELRRVLRQSREGFVPERL